MKRLTVDLAATTLRKIEALAVATQTSTQQVIRRLVTIGLKQQGITVTQEEAA